LSQSDKGSGKEGQTGSQAISLNGATGLVKKHVFSTGYGPIKKKFIFYEGTVGIFFLAQLIVSQEKIRRVPYIYIYICICVVCLLLRRVVIACH